MSDASHAEDMKRHVKIYQRVFFALAVLTILTVSVSYLHLPIIYALIIALLIAISKSSLVASFFMHLISEKRAVFLVLTFTLIFLIAMFILLIGSYYEQEGVFLGGH